MNTVERTGKNALQTLAAVPGSIGYLLTALAPGQTAGRTLVMGRPRRSGAGRVAMVALMAGLLLSGHARAGLEISQLPLFLTQAVAPRVMLNMSNDHQLYFEAYNEYTDLSGDGVPDTTYNHDVAYYGYFDSAKCYDHTGGRFEPRAETSDGYCDGVSGEWSGNFLNWVSMARIDTVRKILYGGLRSTDTPDETVLERSYLPNDAHSWARYYDGDDLSRLTPFSASREAPVSAGQVWDPGEGESRTIYLEELAETVNHDRTIEDGVRLNFDERLEGEPGDQIFLVPVDPMTTLDLAEEGLVEDFDPEEFDNLASGYLVRERSGDQWEVALQYARGEGELEHFAAINPSRRGVTFCNTTSTDTQLSQDVEDPPLLRVAEGDYSLWAGNERWQCQWQEEQSNTLGGWSNDYPAPNSNGNNAAITGLMANTENPEESVVGLGNYEVRTQVCVDGLLEDNCLRYEDGYKPVGLLQEFAGDDRMHFGLMTGSYELNRSGGVLRRNVENITDEFNEDGTFARPDESIIDTLDRLRIYGYRHDDGTYHGTDGSDDCIWGLTDFDEGQCSNWGNPLSELYLESMRYFSGQSSPVFAPSPDRLDLPVADWTDPVDENEYCAPLNTIQFNASTSSYDAESLEHARDFMSSDLDRWTNRVGEGEGIHGNQFFIGETSDDGNGICTAKEIGQLSEARGICPDEPRLGGSYHVAGMAHYARVNDLRPNIEDEQLMETFGVELAPAVPEIPVPDSAGNEAARLLPACREFRSDREQGPDFGSCALVDFKVINQELTDEGSRGSFVVVWEDSEQGGDYDMDMSGILSYELSGDSLEVSTRVFADSSEGQMGFGYVTSGTMDDGFHVHSGIGGYSWQDCDDCNLLDTATSKTFTTGSSIAELLERPLFYAAKWGGFNLERVSNDRPDTQESWDSSGDGQPDNYFFSTNPGQLEDSMAEALSMALEQRGSAAAVAANSTRLDADTVIYQAMFDSTDWSGDLIAFATDEDTGEIAGENWRAAEQMDEQDYDTRRIFSWDDQEGQGIEFSEDEDAVSDHLSSEQVAYLRGDRSREWEEDGPFRDRSTVLGDIVNSDPAFAHDESYGYIDISTPVGTAYRDFLNWKEDRPPMIYVGANDGMLHGFHADTGENLFSYAPGALIPELDELTDPDYSHRYYVDGAPTVADAYIEAGDEDEPRWRTVLVGTLNGGGRSVFALDVTDPEEFDEDNVLWEFSHEELGEGVEEASIVRMAKDPDDEETEHKWVAIFGNGYNSDSQSAQLFAVNMETGELLDGMPIDTEAGDAGDPNGMATTFVADTNGDRNADTVYAGDLHGHLWKFDLDGDGSWELAEMGRHATDGLLFVAEENGNRQPITAKPQASMTSDNDVVVLFGTGKYLEPGDAVADSDPDIQSLYGIIDRGAQVDRDDLLEQEILVEGEESGTPFRVTTDNRPEEDETIPGWRLDLVSPDHGRQGELVINQVLVSGGIATFSTVIPTADDPCGGGGDSWVLGLDAETGARPGFVFFDVDGDGEIDEDDLVEVEIDNEMVEVPASAIGAGVGVAARPTTVSTGTSDIMYISGSDSEEPARHETAGDRLSGRQGWRQVR